MKKIREALIFLRFIRFKRVKQNVNVLIYSISRGGSTLMAEVLTNLLDARLFNEPLFLYRRLPFGKINPFSVNRLLDLKLNWAPYLPNNTNVKIEKYFDDLFSLRVLNMRFLRFTNAKRFGSQKYSVFKFCFGNFIYPYFNQRYGDKSIVLLRHPFAVAASSLSFGEHFSWHKKNYASWRFNTNDFSKDFYKKYENKYELIDSAAAQLIFRASAQYDHILSEINKENSIVIFYEDLISKPMEVLPKLERFLSIKIEETNFLKLISKQSFSSSKNHTNKNIEEQLSKWKKVLKPSEVKQGLRIMRELNLKIYSEDIYPVKS